MYMKLEIEIGYIISRTLQNIKKSRRDKDNTQLIYIIQYSVIFSIKQIFFKENISYNK